VQKDRISLLAAASQELPSVLERAPDQLVGAVKVDRRDAERTRRGNTISWASARWRSMSPIWGDPSC
jgi:hypothetical protein